MNLFSYSDLWSFKYRFLNYNNIEQCKNRVKAELESIKEFFRLKMFNIKILEGRFEDIKQAYKEYIKIISKIFRSFLKSFLSEF